VNAGAPTDRAGDQDGQCLPVPAESDRRDVERPGAPICCEAAVDREAERGVLGHAPKGEPAGAEPRLARDAVCEHHLPRRARRGEPARREDKPRATAEDRKDEPVHGFPLACLRKNDSATLLRGNSANKSINDSPTGRDAPRRDRHATRGSAQPPPAHTPHNNERTSKFVPTYGDRSPP